MRGDVKISGRPLSDFQMFRTVELPEGLERVGSWWFQNSRIETVVVPASVREVGSHAFDWCEKLNSVTFAEGSRLETLSDFAFHKCPSLKCIELPNTTRRIR